MSFTDLGPNYGPSQAQPEQRQTQTPPLQWKETTGEFVIYLTQVPWIEAGTTARFYASFQHIKDGAIQPAGLVIIILDGNGLAYSGSGNASITTGVITQDPNNTNQYFSSVQFGPSVPPGDYLVQWTGTYTPQGISTALSIQSRRPVKVKKTVAPSRFYFKRTDQW